MWTARAAVGLGCLSAAVWALIDGRRRWPWLLTALVVGSVYAGFEDYLVRSADPWSRYDAPRPRVQKLRDFKPLFDAPRPERPPEEAREKP